MAQKQRRAYGSGTSAKPATPPKPTVEGPELRAIRLECLKLSIDARTNRSTLETVLENARGFEGYVLKGSK